MKQTAYSEMLAQLGLVGHRNAVVLGRLSCSMGYGTCLACVNGNVLRLVDTDYSQKPGQVLL